MLPSASLLIHDGSTTLSGSNNKVKDLQKFYGKLDAKVKNIIVENSKITSEEYDENIDRELYILADECKEKGLCDIILGVDCDIDFLY
jgi:ATP-dependent protease ClpP protease subunit